MKKMFSVILIALALVCTSCTTFKVSGLSYGVPAYTQVMGTFEKKITVWKVCGISGGATFANVTQDATEDAIQNAIRNEVNAMGGNAAVNVSIEQKATVGNYIINGLTSEILAPVTIIIRGTVVRY